jgi:NDP-sugar pyrophosphorylase family protein
LIVNGDTLTDCDLTAVAQRHLALGARVTMAVVEGDVQRYGGVLVDPDQRVRGFGKAVPGTRPLHFIGVQAAEAGVFASLPDDQPSETVRTIYPRLIESNPGAIRVHESGAEFLDVGTARDYISTVATIAAREQRPFDIGQGCHIASDARVERSILWDRVTVGAGARLTNCIVADDVVVPDGADYENRILIARTDARATSGPSVDRSDSVYSVDL